MCVFFPFILDVKFVGCTSRGHTGLLIPLPSAVQAFIFLARRTQPFLSLVDREVKFCVCVCVCFLSIHSGHQVGRTSRGHTDRRKVTRFFIHLPSAVRALIFLVRRIQPFLSLVDREVEFFVLTRRFNRSPLIGHICLYFLLLSEKIPFTGIELTSQCVKRLRGYL